jgi:hypothetical protein
MSSAELATVEQPRPRASEQLANFIGMDPKAMLEVVRAQCFKGAATDAQVAAFVVVANEMKLNPLLPGFLYAYPSSGGAIVPILGPDGFYKKLAEHSEIESWEVDVFPEDVTQPPTHATARVYRKGVAKPVTYTALLSEWKQNSNPNWNSRPRHMLQLRALKHAARQVIHGLPGDEDDRHIIQVHESAAAGAPIEANAEIVSPETRADPAAVRGKGGRKKADTSTATTEANTPAATTPPASTEPAKAPESAPAAPPAEKPPVNQRTKLEKGENLTLKGAKILSVKTEDFSGNPGVIAEVETEVFKGTVYDLNGAKMDGEKRVPLPLWDPANALDITLLGRGSKLGVLALVEKITVSPKGGNDLGLES